MLLLHRLFYILNSEAAQQQLKAIFFTAMVDIHTNILSCIHDNRLATGTLLQQYCQKLALAYSLAYILYGIFLKICLTL